MSTEKPEARRFTMQSCQSTPLLLLCTKRPRHCCHFSVKLEQVISVVRADVQLDFLDAFEPMPISS